MIISDWLKARLISIFLTLFGISLYEEMTTHVYTICIVANIIKKNFCIIQVI